MPKVSVVIPTYNRVNTLLRAINSVLNQTYQDFEIVIVDDGSTDNTKSVIEDFQKKDNRIKYFYQENSGGPAKPLNLGIKNSIGEYITFLADDDEFSPTYIEKLLTPFKLSKKNVDVTSCNVLIIDEKGKIFKEISKPKNTDNSYILNTSLIYNYVFGNIFVKREVFNKVGFFDEKIKIREDFDLWLRLAKNNFRFEFIYEPLYLIRGHQKKIGVTITTNPLERIRIDRYLIKKHHEVYAKYPKSYAVTLRRIGTMYVCIGNMKEARKYFMRAIKKDPLNLRHYVNLILSFFGRDLFVYILELKNRVIL